MANESQSALPDAALRPNRIGSEPLPSIWRQRLPYLLLSLIGGIIVGTPFLIFAFLIHPDAASPYSALFFAGSSAIIIGPAAISVFGTWHRSRKIAHRNRRTAQ